MMNSSPPHIRRLIIRCCGETHRLDRTKDELFAAEALLMLSRSTLPPSLLLHKNGHKCLLCERTFATHQALGGHMTRHRKKTIQTTMQPPVSADKSDVVSDITDSVEKVRNHECLTCNATFSTGQQFGGHKRKHYQQSSGNESDESKRRLLVLFDQQPCSSREKYYAATSRATIAAVHPDLDLKLSL